MANTVKLKRGSGSDPSASDLVLGEIAIRTDNGKIFLKKDDGSVAEVSGGGGIDDGDKGDITVSNSGDTWTIDASATQVANKLPLAGGTLTDDTTLANTKKVIFNASSGAGAFIKHQSGHFEIDNNVGNTYFATTGVLYLRTNGSTDALTLDASQNATFAGTVTGTFSGNITGNVTGNTSGSSGSCTGNAATATTLATARTIAGVSFDGSANISLNNNAITNGAGYITATLTEEQVEDYVGGMVTGNTETGITVTYQDADGTLDFVVASQTDNNFTTTLKNKLDGIAAGATNVTNNNQLTNGASYITSSGTSAACSGNSATATALATARTIGGTSFDGTANISVALADTATALATARTIAGVSFDGSANISLNNNAITNGAGYITATLTEEQVEDYVGGMVTGNTETGITVTYQDADGTLDFVVASQTDNNFTTTLKNKLDGIATGATNVSNTNQLTNGAGFITATLTEEQVEDYVGGMVTGNTETGITVTYQDADGTLDFVVATQSDNNFTTTLKNKLDGIAASATNVTNNNQLTNGASYVTSSIINSLNASNLDSGTVGTARLGSGTASSSTYLRGDGSWATISAGAEDGIFWENDQAVSSNYTITNNKNAMSAGPITINSGVTVTVGSGENWTIV